MGCRPSLGRSVPYVDGKVCMLINRVSVCRIRRACSVNTLICTLVVCSVLALDRLRRVILGITVKGHVVAVGIHGSGCRLNRRYA